VKLSKGGTKVEEVELDMTPMIDVVFNLIIFFMIVSDMSNLDLEQVDLPFASHAKAEKASGDDVTKTIKVNVRADGGIIISGKPYTMDADKKNVADDQGRQVTWLQDYLKVEADAEEREDPDPKNPGLRPSKLNILIRGDKNAPYKFIGDVMEACSKNTIYKTSVAATPDDPNKG
jgi:biopolymer transport protein ExbD